MSEPQTATQTSTQTSTEGEKPAEAGGKETGKTFTQADVDRIVQDRIARERERFADYDDLRARAEGAKTLEDRVADIEKNARDAEQRATRAEVANAKGLTPTQAKRLVGTTREELEADADALLADLGAQRTTGNVAPSEGGTTQAKPSDMQQFTDKLFGRQ